jgi:hypothetical protein
MHNDSFNFEYFILLTYSLTYLRMLSVAQAVRIHNVNKKPTCGLREASNEISYISYAYKDG